MTALYIRNRKEAAAIARIARRFGRKTSIRDLYANDRYLINVAERLFGAEPEKVQFVAQCQLAIARVRNETR